MKLAGAAEGQRILGVSAARWYRLVQEPGFPAPEDVLDCGTIWREDVLRHYARVRPNQRRRRIDTPRTSDDSVSPTNGHIPSQPVGEGGLGPQNPTSHRTDPVTRRSSGRVPVPPVEGPRPPVG
jgi:hypothetical protein